MAKLSKSINDINKGKGLSDSYTDVDKMFDDIISGKTNEQRHNRVR